MYSKSFTNHRAHARSVRSVLRNAEVALKLSKYSFSDNAASHLGHAIRPEEMAADNKNSKAIRQIFLSTNHTELRYSIEMRSVYSSFVSSLTRGAAPLIVQTVKNQLFELESNEVELDSFQELKNRLVFVPVIALL